MSVDVRSLLSVALAGALLVAACGNDDDTASTTTSAVASTSTSTSTSTSPSAGGDEGAAGSATTEPSDPAGETPAPGTPTDNSLVILGDTLGVRDSCAGRDAAQAVEYRYDLSNGGSLTLTISGSVPVRIVYEGRSGTFSGEQDALGEARADDGFVTGTGTLRDAAGAETQISYRVTRPIVNCDAPDDDAPADGADDAADPGTDG